MFDGTGVPDIAAVRGFAAALAAAGPGLGDAERVDALRALEELKAAAAAAQAQLAADLDASVRAARAAEGVPAAKRGVGVATQVALARRESPYRGGQHLGLAKALVHEMPHTLAGLRAGWLSEWRATLLVRETACLSVQHRAAVDAALCADPATLDGVGDGALVARAKALAYRLDPESVVARRARADSERRVSLRPAPDCMTRLSALLPAAHGVSALAALSKAADTARAAGDPRTRGQVMADTLVERLTGQTHADQTPVALRLVMTDRALLGDTDESSDEPAHLHGYGPIPAETARGLVRDLLDRAHDGGPQLWLRRLFTHPQTGELTGMDARSRRFPPALRELITLRDQTCRTPWCDAPIRHLDHATPATHGGPTTEDNGNGLCEACNLAKEAGRLRVHAGRDPDGRHRITITTPTGHTYTSRPPPLPGAA